MARSKINRKAKTCTSNCAITSTSRHITPALLGHRSPQDVHNAINFHRATLSEEVCQFLQSNPPNLRIFIEFWSRPQYSGLASGRAADTICGASWMIALNYLLLDQLDMSRRYMLNGAFIHQCAHKPLNDILELCNNLQKPLYDDVVDAQLPYYQGAFLLSRSKADIEKYLMRVVPSDLRKQMSFASHAAHKSRSSTWVQDYVNCIDSDWGSSSSQPKRVIKGIDESYINITILNTESNDSFHMSTQVSRTLKEVFTKYSEEKGTPLRSLRFIFDGKPLFLSTASNKTPSQLGMRDHDVMCVSSVISSNTSTQNEDAETRAEPSKKALTKKNHKKRTNRGKRAKSSHVAYIKQVDHKVEHSRALTRLFQEAGPQFQVIRQQLNNLSLERTQPKEKSFKRRATASVNQPVNNPNLDGMMGKAGKSSYLVHVGEVNNLYKSSKKSSVNAPRSKIVDLHGCSQLEALEKLNESLPQWERYAMEGSYPFVAPVVIVCGGGNQVLSETVQQWIHEHPSVANAPKNMFASAA